MLALPISKRSVPVYEKIATSLEETLSPLHRRPVYQRTICLNGLQLNVKNTFIDSEATDSEEEQPSCHIHHMGAHTCIAKFAAHTPFEHVQRRLSLDALLPTLPHGNTHAANFSSDHEATSTSLSAWDGAVFIVKNTFIEISAPKPDLHAEPTVHNSGARTCRASSSSSLILFEADDSVSTIALDSGDTDDTDDTDRSDVEVFENTPFDYSPFHDGSERKFFPVAPDAVQNQMGRFLLPCYETRASLNLCNALASAKCAPSCSSTTPVCCHWKNKGWCKLGPNCKFAHPAEKRGVGATERQKKDSLAARLSAQIHVESMNRDLAVPPFPGEGKSDKVCCHWKNKGWCKFQDTCKFQHPAALATQIHEQSIHCDVDVPPPPLPCEEKSDKVCCHWKNKGWCKFQDACKFQHPAHKHGVGSATRMRTLTA